MRYAAIGITSNTPFSAKYAGQGVLGVPSVVTSFGSATCATGACCVRRSQQDFGFGRKTDWMTPRLDPADDRLARGNELKYGRI